MQRCRCIKEYTMPREPTMKVDELFPYYYNPISKHLRWVVSAQGTWYGLDQSIFDEHFEVVK